MTAFHHGPETLELFAKGLANPTRGEVFAMLRRACALGAWPPPVDARHLAQWLLDHTTGEAKEEDLMQEPMLQFFAYSHLPEELRRVSAPFGDLARALVETLPRNPERSAALRKLLEAKDCAVRASIYEEPEGTR